MSAYLTNQKMSNKGSVMNLATNTDNKKLVHRKFPLLVRILIFLYVALMLSIIGLMIGYGILDNPFEVFRIETWEHIINLTKE